MAITIILSGISVVLMLAILTLIHEMKERIMATLADIQADVTAQSTVIASVVTLLQGLNDQLKAAVAANDPAAIQAVIDSIDTNTKSLADAVTANTPVGRPA